MIHPLGVKPPTMTSEDIAIGGRIAFVIFLSIIAALGVLIRRIRQRAMAERADRELRDEIDALDRERR